MGYDKKKRDSKSSAEFLFGLAICVRESLNITRHGAADGESADCPRIFAPRDPLKQLSLANHHVSSSTLWMLARLLPR